MTSLIATTSGDDIAKASKLVAQAAVGIAGKDEMLLEHTGDDLYLSATDGLLSASIKIPSQCKGEWTACVTATKFSEACAHLRDAPGLGIGDTSITIAVSNRHIKIAQKDYTAGELHSRKDLDFHDSSANEIVNIVRKLASLTARAHEANKYVTILQDGIVEAGHGFGGALFSTGYTPTRVIGIDGAVADRAMTIIGDVADEAIDENMWHLRSSCGNRVSMRVTDQHFRSMIRVIMKVNPCHKISVDFDEFRSSLETCALSNGHGARVRIDPVDGGIVLRSTDDYENRSAGWCPRWAQATVKGTGSFESVELSIARLAELIKVITPSERPHELVLRVCDHGDIINHISMVCSGAEAFLAPMSAHGTRTKEQHHNEQDIPGKSQ